LLTSSLYRGKPPQQLILNLFLSKCFFKSSPTWGMRENIPAIYSFRSEMTFWGEVDVMALPSKSHDRRARSEVNRKLPSSEQLIREWLTDLSAARIMLDDQRNILWTNRAGAELLSGQHCLVNADGKLVPTSQRNLTALLSLMKEALDQPKATLFCEESHLPLVVQVHAITGGDLSRHSVCYGLFASGFGPLSSDRMVDFRTAFNLTRAENEIALQLLNGKKLRAIASENTVSIQTVRTQVKRIFQKMNVAGKEEFYSLALRCII
jgi:DNA-binding CsgD family transcriptional regulator